MWIDIYASQFHRISHLGFVYALNPLAYLLVSKGGGGAEWQIILDGSNIRNSSAPQARNFLADFPENGHWTLLKFIFYTVLTRVAKKHFFEPYVFFGKKKNMFF